MSDEKREEEILNNSGEAHIPADELEKRKKQIMKFFKEKWAWIYAVLFAFIGFIGLRVRVLNLSKLKDITTGTYTLGPDLDPFLFLRWAKYIVEHGKLMILDAMRYAPLEKICSGVQCGAIDTSSEMKFLPYLIAYFYKFLSAFSKKITVTYAADIFPVVMFALTIVAFFLFARKVFYKLDKNRRNIIALISTSLFALIPSLLPRTIAGIPEKESAAFFFIFLSLYFFLEAFTSEKLKKGIIFGVLSGISTGILGFIWGGVIFIFIAIPVAVLFAFIMGKIREKEFYIFCSWVVSMMISMMPFSPRYSLSNLITSTSSEVIFLVLFILLVDFLIFKKKIFHLDEKLKKIKLPGEVISILISLFALIIFVCILFGPSFIIENVKEFTNLIANPANPNRFSVTVAENKKPYFRDDWRNEFGPILFNIPLFFWMFFIGSIWLFNYLIKSLNKKEKIFLTIGYFIFLFCLIFSNYSPSSTLNGENGISAVVYIGGALFFIAGFAYVYYKRHKKGELSVFKELEFSYILYFILFTLGLIVTRGGIRYIMVLGAISPIAAGFLIFKLPERFFKEKEDAKKFFFAVLAILVIFAYLFTLWNYYNADKTNGENYAPGSYQWQWQKAMAWVRDNTQKDAVFAHWWDYGYWVQSIGERATILDGGNAIGYWNYLMGRMVLTSPNENDTLQFLYTHDATHLLIDSTDIGKYTAFSSIGSDANYDRFSWISTFLMDSKQTQETKDQKMYIYTGGSANDEDITYTINGTKIFLPGQSSAVAAIIVGQDSEKNILQPQAIFQYNGMQYRIPLRYAYSDSTGLIDFNSGLDAGVFIFPSVVSDSTNGMGVNNIGALLYLSPRTIHSQLARLYLFDTKTSNFNLVHTESDTFISYLRSQGLNTGEFLYYNGFLGPIKIWELNYPQGIQANPEYLKLEYPSPDLESVNPGYA